MTRKEFYKLRRKWRLIRNCITSPKAAIGQKCQSSVDNEAWSELCDFAYNNSPEAIRGCEPVSRDANSKWDFSNRSEALYLRRASIKCNISLLPPSYRNNSHEVI